MQVLRVQSAEGTKRIDVSSQDTYRELYGKIANIFSKQPNEFVLYREQNKKSMITRSSAKHNLRHGDMIYLVNESDNSPSSETTSVIMKPNISIGNFDFLDRLIDSKEDEVDVQLDKLDGKIARQMNSKLCQHNKHGKCFHCMPIEPYNEDYLKNHNPPIKYMSFQAYLRKLQNEKKSFASLENINCSIKDKCSTGHPQWPKGICTKCQPNPMTLMSQTYRHVDNIMFENGNLVNRFLEYWREYSHQRIGFLYGRYEVYDGVPLGIRAVVSAIYEPPQETSKDTVQLILPDPDEAIVDKLAASLGLRRIGWIFTDLIPNNKRSSDGPVLHHRADTYFLTAQECIMAGWYQNKYLNTCKYSSDGYFGSKFVTVVVTGDAQGQIHFEGYQVSNQCMALIKSQILIPTIDAPELGYIKETTQEQYVPDVYYKEKDSYNNEIMKIARPFPLEYLIIDIPTGFPAENTRIDSIFNDQCSIIQTSFPIENRQQIREIQDMDTLTLYIQQFYETKSKIFTSKDILADFHLLKYLITNDIYSFSLDELNPLLNCLKSKNLDGIDQWLMNDHWQIFLQLLQIEFPKYSIISNSSSDWSCLQCTFQNKNSNLKCDVCASDKMI